MNRSRWLFAAWVLGLFAMGCVTIPSVPKGPVLGPQDALPPDPGPGLLFIRVVSSAPDLPAYAVIVYVGNSKAPVVKAIVGPVEDWPGFFSKVRAAYWAHGPGEAYCARPDGGAACNNDMKRGDAGPYQQLPPPHPPPPADGYAISYSTQSGTVDPTSSSLNDSAAAAAAATAAALGQ